MPAQPHAQPPAQGYAMPPPGAPRSMKGLAIGLGVGMVAVTGVIIALVVMRGGRGGGHGSREDLVKGTLAAMSAGNVDKLVELSDPVGLHARTFDCSERDKDSGAGDRDPDKDGDVDQDADKATADDAGEVDDPQIQEKRIRRQAEKLVEKTKGLKIELVSIAGGEAKDGGGSEDTGRSLAMKKGDRAMKGCVLKVDVRFHDLVAKVRITEADATEAAEQEVQLAAIDAGGSWYLMSAPKVSAGVGAIGAKLRAYKDQMCACKDAACAEKVQADAKAWGKTVEQEAKELSKEQRQALDEIDEEMKACRRKLRDGDPVGDAGDAGDADGDAGGDVAAREVLAKLEAYKAKMCACADLGCAARVQQDMASWYAVAASRLAAMKASPEEERRAEELMKVYAECAEKLAKGDGPGSTDDPLPPEEPPPGGGTSGGGGAGAAALASVPACADYRRQIDKILACPKYPRSAGEAMKQAYEQMEKSWAATAGTPSARETWIKSCVTGAEALKKLVDSMCP
ncbi:MAG TPA: hypothetical protein VK932_21185 [Kofleriaceae bacterium]|nr:hypothetical protein [Kofleriaceae bacterium]